MSLCGRLVDDCASTSKIKINSYYSRLSIERPQSKANKRRKLKYLDVDEIGRLCKAVETLPNNSGTNPQEGKDLAC